MTVCPHCRRDVGTARFCPYDGTPLAHLGASLELREPRAGDLVDGRYRIEAELGRGGIGIVFLARAEGLATSVAIKVLKPELAARKQTVARFAREARASSRIDHENVVRVFDFGFAVDGFYYLVMELLEGRALSEVLEDHGRLSPRRTLHLLRQVAAGMARAHELGVIHRDLKPSNIMVNRRDGDHVTLVDFGLSKTDTGWSGAQMTHEGDLLGTPDYMAPEQWLGRMVDARADVYAFGVMSYEMLSGVLPFHGETQVVLMQSHLEDPPVPLEERGLTNLPPGLGALVLRCLAKKASERPDDMRVVSRALEAMDRAIDEERTAAHTLPLGTELVLGDIGSLSSDEVGEEIARLVQVRRRRLAALIPECFPDGAPADVQASLADLTRREDSVDRLGEELALARERLDELARARREREASLRERLVRANVHVAVQRAGLPRELASASLDPAALDPALLDVESAELHLAAHLRDEVPALEESRARHAALADALAEAQASLDVGYDALEARLREVPAPADEPHPVSMLTRLEGAIAAYRAQLERLQRNRSPVAVSGQ